jgi:hypothetical protein
MKEVLVRNIDRPALSRRHTKPGTVVENMLVALLGIVMCTAFLVVIFGAFRGVSDKWQMRQAARETLLIMETDGYLKPEDANDLTAQLRSYGLYNISLAGSTRSEVHYGDRIYLRIQGTYNENILSFAGGISKVADHPATITIERQSTAKQ